jgi:signal transduction histidine kinase
MATERRNERGAGHGSDRGNDRGNEQRKAGVKARGKAGVKARGKAGVKAGGQKRGKARDPERGKVLDQEHRAERAGEDGGEDGGEDEGENGDARGDERGAELEAMMAALGSADWARALEGVAATAAWVQATAPGDARAGRVVEKLVALGGHPKWEVRRAVAHAAAQTRHGDFEKVLARLVTDHNARVRQAAESAALRRRDWANASALGRQHEEHVNATLDDIEARFGVRGRSAVKRASEHIANTFARELYHEVIKLLTPLATSADRLVQQLGGDGGAGGAPRGALVGEVGRMKERIARLRSVLEAMRAYTAQPRLELAVEHVREVAEESAALVRDARRGGPPIHVDIAPEIRAEVCRPRLVQALTNLLTNAIEACSDLPDAAPTAAPAAPPITVTAHAEQDRVVIAIEDHGCGMTDEVLADATVLFSTSKPGGTGFGLPLVVKIVESEHEGRLTLESRPGHGTTARVILPARRPGGRA